MRNAAVYDPFSFSLFPLCCLLPAACYPLSAIGYQLSAIGYLPPAACCLLPAASYRLSAICRLLPAIGYPLSAIRYRLSALQCAPCAPTDELCEPYRFRRLPLSAQRNIVREREYRSPAERENIARAANIASADRRKYRSIMRGPAAPPTGEACLPSQTVTIPNSELRIPN